jgi:hypothetical protein
MPSQSEKLEAHASHLLDAFLRLRERYAMLEPMLFDPVVPERYGSGVQARGFKTLRHSLFLSCAQDIAKLSLDSDKRTPSIKNLMESIEDTRLCMELKDKYAIWVIPDAEIETEPEILAVLKKIELQEEEARRVQFDDILAKVRCKWSKFEIEPYLFGFLTIRDKISAHTEVLLVHDEYQFVDIGGLNIKWSDISRAIESMQSIIEDLGLVIRNSGFAWDSLDRQLLEVSSAFWSVGNKGSEPF